MKNYYLITTYDSNHCVTVAGVIYGNPETPEFGLTLQTVLAEQFCADKVDFIALINRAELEQPGHTTINVTVMEDGYTHDEEVMIEGVTLYKA